MLLFLTLNKDPFPFSQPLYHFQSTFHIIMTAIIQSLDDLCLARQFPVGGSSIIISFSFGFILRLARQSFWLDIAIYLVTNVSY